MLPFTLFAFISYLSWKDCILDKRTKDLHKYYLLKGKEFKKKNLLRIMLNGPLLLIPWSLTVKLCKRKCVFFRAQGTLRYFKIFL